MWTRSRLKGAIGVSNFASAKQKLSAALEVTMKARPSVSDHPKAAKADPKDFFDNRFLKGLEETGFIQELYGRR